MAASAGSDPERQVALEGGAWLVAEKLPLLALSVASSSDHLPGPAEGGFDGQAGVASFALRLCNVLTAYLRYIGGMIWPFDLTMFYPYQTQLDATYVTYAVIAAGCCW